MPRRRSDATTCSTFASREVTWTQNQRQIRSSDVPRHYNTITCRGSNVDECWQQAEKCTRQEDLAKSTAVEYSPGLTMAPKAWRRGPRCALGARYCSGTWIGECGCIKPCAQTADAAAGEMDSQRSSCWHSSKAEGIWVACGADQQEE